VVHVDALSFSMERSRSPASSAISVGALPSPRFRRCFHGERRIVLGHALTRLRIAAMCWLRVAV
jgi:hypothetical protein